MPMLNSTEFVALCQAQVVLLTQALGASLSVVYLTQELADSAETQLIPVVAYPEAVDWQAQGVTRSLTAAIDRAKPALWLAAPHAGSSHVKHLPASAASESTVQTAAATRDRSTMSDRALNAKTASQAAALQAMPSEPTQSESSSSEPTQSEPSRSKHSPSEPSPSEPSQSERVALVPERRIVLPLMHEGVVLGLLVTERSDRPWSELEQTQIHQIADTLAIARVLDQRYQWLEQDQRQAQQHDLLDNLLHQFRNSLTTLQTFGKLILRRLLPDDANRDVVASLVRETARLRDLAEQLEGAVASPEALKTSPLALPPASRHTAHAAAIADLPNQPGDRQPDQHASDAWQTAQTLPLLPAAGFLAGTAFVLEPCPLPLVLEPLLAAARAIAQERSLTLLTDIPSDLPPVLANRQLLQEVLSNTIDNALKYTPAGGQVLLQARLQEGKQEGKQAVEIAVTDNGVGIPSEDLSHVFERRYRGVQAQTGIPGSGLGLAIARALVTQMQGEICVFSPARINSLDQRNTDALTTHGRGTTVVVRLAIA